MSVHPGAGLQFQDVFIRMERPNSGEGRIQMLDNSQGASIEKRFQRSGLAEYGRDIGVQARVANFEGPIALGLFSVFDLGVRPIPSAYDALRVPEGSRAK